MAIAAKRTAIAAALRGERRGRPENFILLLEKFIVVIFVGLISCFRGSVVPDLKSKVPGHRWQHRAQDREPDRLLDGGVVLILPEIDRIGIWPRIGIVETEYPFLLQLLPLVAFHDRGKVEAVIGRQPVSVPVP